VLAVILTASFGLTAVAASSSSNASQGNTGPYATASKSNGTKTVAQATGNMPPADFGSPPSGEVPILFNDHHVYSKPDRLKQGRVLAALIKGGTILVPLRSMFEQTGATVSYDPGTKTVDVSKPGSDVKVTVGKPEVIINGESRPLDVPPEIYKGAVVVPVRVIAEGMGAYVQWVPDKHLVVVRYIPVVATPPPPPTPAPTLPPTPAPSPTPSPRPTPAYEKFIAGDYIFSPKVYNEFSPGNTGTSSGAVRGAIEFPLFNLPWMLEGDYRQFTYPHNQNGATPANFDRPGCFGVQPGDQGCVTVIGVQQFSGATFVPAFQARDYDFDGRFGLKVADPRIYIGVGYMWRSNNYGYPKLNGVGFGAEKLPDLDQPFSIYGSAYYYPTVKGNYSVPNFDPVGNCALEGAHCQTATFSLSYRILKYQIGGTFNFGTSPLFLDFGYLGDRGTVASNGPSDFTHNGPYVGLGLHF
jgi:hypothetical protein